MAGFRKAKAEQAALKIGMYGAPGSGKTFTALLCAEGLAKACRKRVAYVDTERGTDFYCKEVPTRQCHPSAFDFDAVYTKSLTEALSEVCALNSETHGIVVIDSITHLWESARNAYAGKINAAGQIPFHAWGKIKKPYKDLVGRLLSSPMHVFILGRQGNEFAEDDETGELKRVGTKMKAEGETAYEPHILLRMEAIRQKSGPALVTAFAEKDRTGILAGRTIEAPDFDSLIKPIMPLLGGTQAVIESEDATAAKDAESIAESDRQRAETGAAIFKNLCAKMDLATTMDELKKIGKEITPEAKREMTTDMVASLREKYFDLEGELKR